MNTKVIRAILNTKEDIFRDIAISTTASLEEAMPQ